MYFNLQQNCVNKSVKKFRAHKFICKKIISCINHENKSFPRTTDGQTSRMTAIGCFFYQRKKTTKNGHSLCTKLGCSYHRMMVFP